MRKRSSKLAMLLILSLLFTSVFPGNAFADESVNRDVLCADALLAELDDDLQVKAKETVGLAGDFIPLEKLIEVKVQGEEIVYVFQLSDKIISEVIVEVIENGVKYIVTEGAITNELVVLNDGTMKVDGKAIVYTEQVAEMKTMNLLEANNVSSPRVSLSDYTYLYECPYGSPSDYGQFIIQESVANVAFQQEVQFIATSLVVGIVTGMLFEKVVAGAIGGTIYETIVRHCENLDPTCDAISYKKWRYVHSEEGYYLSDVRYSLEKQKINMYSMKNFYGTITSMTVYEKFLPNI